MWYLGQIVVTVLAVGLSQNASNFDRDRIKIIDTGYVPYTRTSFDAGPAVGDMLNAHYFPGINFYLARRYSNALEEFTYVIDRPHYLDGNLKQGEFLSTASYLRGMIYLYHGSGVGRHSLAKADFENALNWNSANHLCFI